MEDPILLHILLHPIAHMTKPQLFFIGDDDSPSTYEKENEKFLMLSTLKLRIGEISDEDFVKSICSMNNFIT